MKDPPIIVRAMADDIYEVQSYQGSHFIRLLRCLECNDLVNADLFRGGNLVCNYCAHVERERERKAARRAEKIADLRIAAKRRSATLELAAPKWRDKDKIKQIYDRARRLTAETGILHHVDHYYPVQGRLCCGLHVHDNLRVLPASENCSKGNEQPLEDSPATVAFIKQYGAVGLDMWIKWAKADGRVTWAK